MSGGDFAVILVFLVAGAIAGFLFAAVQLATIAIEVVERRGRSAQVDGPVQTREQRRRRALKIALIGIAAAWAALFAVDAGYVACRVHWLQGQTTIYLEHSTPYYWEIIGPLFVACQIFTAFLAYRVKSLEGSRTWAIIWSVAWSLIQATALFCADVFISWYAHFAAGGGE